MDIDQHVGRSEMTPTRAEMDHLARAKHAQTQNRSKGKQSTVAQPKQATTAQYTEPGSQASAEQAAIPLWQTNVPGYLDDMPNEAAEMRPFRVANTLVPNIVLKYPYGLPVAVDGLEGTSGGHNSTDGGWDDMSDCSFAYSHESLAFGGGTSDFG
ncbi:hypothetical protein E4T44_10129 [Aureobasidium sp. EXF-8845]|nr:hypothetical protein E4T45_14619 [Aureobasidium sp. EXF-8846]KAI4823172.1 hypothetical protein E4T44_10129 [Aureobasidium sp. EXF-8845]